MNRTTRTTLISIATAVGLAATQANAAIGLIEPASWPAKALGENARMALGFLQPSEVDRLRLEARLAQYRAIAEADGLPRVPDEQALRQGDIDDAVADLRRHLIATGDLSSETAYVPEQFTTTLREALERYQTRHGLAADGVFGPKTAAAMNVPLEQRIATIVLNVERLRDADIRADRRRVEVNVAAQEMRYLRDGEIVHQARVVVGQPSWETPIFSDSMETVVLNPTWTVTRRIAAAEILPKLREDPGYLARKNMVLYADWNANATVDPYSVDWSAVNGATMPYMVRQQAGPDNALGRVKFMFPNEHSVYLHDTPSKRLFERPVRAFSHGCVRLEDPLDFAKRILADVNGMAPEQVDRIVASGRTGHVRLHEPVAIDIVYRTAWVDEAGTLHFRPDIYDRDVTSPLVADADAPRPGVG